MTTTQHPTTKGNPSEGESRRPADRGRARPSAGGPRASGKAAEHPGVLRSQIDEKVKKAARLSAPSDEELARAEDENMTAPEVSDDNA
jgi:hypothetical protein